MPRKEVYQKYREDSIAYSKKWQKEHPEKTKHRRERRLRHKIEVMLHYTKIFDPTATEPHCRDIFHLHLPNDPIAKDIDCLSIDHIDGGGNEHRKTIGSHINEWLIARNFPSGYQVLCMSCQWKKKIMNKEYLNRHMNRV